MKLCTITTLMGCQHWSQLVAKYVIVVMVSGSLFGQMAVMPAAENNTGIHATTGSKNRTKNESKRSPILSPTNQQLVFDSKGTVVICPSSPFVDCGSYSSTTTSTTIISSSTINSRNIDSSKSIMPRGRHGKKSPIVINLINVPRWLGREVPEAKECSRDLCVFRYGVDVTKETDVVAVHAKLLTDAEKPPVRWEGQLYVLMNWEPPSKYESRLTTGTSAWNREFNLTMSYRLDSDIFVPSQYLRFEPKPLGKRPNYGDIFMKKRKTAVWFVSNCHTPSERENYVYEMMKYIDVDIYGACGQPAPCAFSMEDQPCLFEILQDYKFYLSFENSFCADYVTEKAFKIYTRDTYVVPVMRGALDYDKYLPANSFINAAHFPNPKDLALHLKQLGSDLAEYTKYLEYKDMYEMIPLGNKFCELCLALHHPMLRPEIYDIQKWIWSGCYYPPDLPEVARGVLWTLFLLLVWMQCLFCYCLRRTMFICDRRLVKSFPVQLCQWCIYTFSTCFRRKWSILKFTSKS